MQRSLLPVSQRDWQALYSSLIVNDRAGSGAGMSERSCRSLSTKLRGSKRNSRMSAGFSMASRSSSRVMGGIVSVAAVHHLLSTLLESRCSLPDCMISTRCNDDLEASVVATSKENASESVLEPLYMSSSSSWSITRSNGRSSRRGACSQVKDDCDDWSPWSL